MTYICRNVLRGLQSIVKDTDDTLSLVDGEPFICLYNDPSTYYDYSKYKNEINSIIKELVRTGYLEYDFNEYHFSLTHKGFHPYLYTWEDVRNFIFKSIIIPIAVSVATTVVTLCITQWL